MDEHDRWRQDGQSYTFEPEPELNQSPKRRRSHAGVFPFLLLLILVGCFAACLGFGKSLQFDRYQAGFSVRLDDAAPAAPVQQPEQPRQEHTPLPDPELQTSLDYAAQSSLAVDSEDLGLKSLSVNSQGKTMTLQNIYKKMIPSYVSIGAALRNGRSSGSGIILTSDGYIATNAHVVQDASMIQITLQDGFILPAELIGCDTVTDLAVLKVELTGLTPAEFGDSDTLEVGDVVVAIGDPLGSELRGSMTDGIISAINRDLQVDGRSMTLIQTNAALNEGNSGGPLINQMGQVIGINTMKMSSAYSSIEGLGFAIPSTMALPILEELMEQGYISGRPALGFEGITVPAYASAFYRLPQGVYIRSVDESSEAAEKGLRPGDVVTAWNMEAIYDLDDLNEYKNASAAGDSVRLTIFRQGSYYYLDLVLAQATN